MCCALRRCHGRNGAPDFRNVQRNGAGLRCAFSAPNQAPFRGKVLCRRSSNSLSSERSLGESRPRRRRVGAVGRVPDVAEQAEQPDATAVRHNPGWDHNACAHRAVPRLRVERQACSERQAICVPRPHARVALEKLAGLGTRVADVCKLMIHRVS